MARWVVLVACLSAMGCGSRLDEELVDGLRHLSGVVRSSGAGTAQVRVKVEPDETAWLVTSQVDAPLRTHVRSVSNADNERVFDALDHLDPVRSRTNAAYVAEVVSLNWPIDARDEALEKGRWEVVLGAVDAEDRWTQADIEVDILLKADDDFSRGDVHASVVYAGDVADDPAFVDATEQALEIWASLYADVGMNLSWDFYTHPEGQLEPPALGSGADYLTISRGTPLRTINVVIGEVIRGFDDVYGIAGDIPGPLVPTGKSAILVSALLAAGPDGTFTDEELRLYGETMAHEAGHFLGLFHPVEAEFDKWDALPDTPECPSEQRCVEDLGRNLMFPFPVCSFVACLPQDEITPDQAGVAHRHVVVD